VAYARFADTLTDSGKKRRQQAENDRGRRGVGGASGGGGLRSETSKLSFAGLDSVLALEPFALLGRIIGIITPGGIGQELYLQLHSRPIICSLLGWFHHQIAPLCPVGKPGSGKYILAPGAQIEGGCPVKEGWSLVCADRAEIDQIQESEGFRLAAKSNVHCPEHGKVKNPFIRTVPVAKEADFIHILPDLLFRVSVTMI
jgi:hypothetical protein